MKSGVHQSDSEIRYEIVQACVVFINISRVNHHEFMIHAYYSICSCLSLVAVYVYVWVWGLAAEFMGYCVQHETQGNGWGISVK